MADVRKERHTEKSFEDAVRLYQTSGKCHHLAVLHDYPPPDGDVRKEIP